jgi:hypothetical protein
MSRRSVVILIAFAVACGPTATNTPATTETGASTPAIAAATASPTPPRAPTASPPPTLAASVAPAPALTVAPTPTPTTAQTGCPRVTSVTAVGDTITVTYSRAMLQIGEGSGVEMSGNYLLDGRALPSATNLGCQTRECLTLGIELPEGTLVPGTTHALRVANVVAQNGPGLEPDPTTVAFTDGMP